MIRWPLFRYALIAALRDKLILMLALLLVVGASLSIFMGSAAVAEADQFALVFAGGGLRMAGVLGLSLFIVFYLRKSFDSKDVEYLLSRPVSRISFITTHAAAFSCLALILGGFVFLTVCAIGPHHIGAGHYLWGFSLIVEYIIIANIAMFFAMVLPNATAGTLAVMAFYVLARMIGEILGIMDSGILPPRFEFASTIMEFISLVIPRLDLLAQTGWLLYGAEGISYLFVAIQGIVFTALVVLAAMIDLSRRQF